MAESGSSLGSLVPGLSLCIPMQTSFTRICGIHCMKDTSFIFLVFTDEHLVYFQSFLITDTLQWVTLHMCHLLKKTYLSALHLSCITPGLQFSLRHVGSTSMIRDRTRPSALGAWSLSHWTTREISICHLFYMK